MVPLNQHRGLFPFAGRNMWFLEVAYFVAKMLESTEGEGTERRTVSSLLSLGLPGQRFGAEIHM